jgi:CheY-like chemotaxis protein
LKTVLVADDSKICLDVLKTQLKELNALDRCEFFFTGDTVLERAI